MAEKKLTRVHALAAVLALACAYAFSLASGAHAAQPTLTVTVEPGDTLWSIAARTTTDPDIRDAVDRIVADNGLPSVALQPGQRITIRR